MVGIPGAGKTSAATIIAEITGAVHIWADHERRTIHSQPTYSQQENDELYHRLNSRANELLGSNHSVVFDTAFNHYSDRQKLRKIAEGNDATTIIVWVQAPKDIAKTRAQNVHEHKHTRVLGNMSDEHFGSLSEKLEEPRSDECTVILDGTKLSPDYITQELSKITA